MIIPAALNISLTIHNVNKRQKSNFYVVNLKTLPVSFLMLPCHSGTSGLQSTWDVSPKLLTPCIVHVSLQKQWMEDLTNAPGKVWATPTFPNHEAIRWQRRGQYPSSLLSPQKMDSLAGHTEHSSTKEYKFRYWILVPPKGAGRKKIRLHVHQDPWKETADGEICQRINSHWEI